MKTYALRTGDRKVPISSEVRTLAAHGFRQFTVEFWMVASGSAIEGVGFTITGERTTDFLTWSEGNPWHVWSGDGSPHVVRDLLVRGLGLPDGEAARFLVAWCGPSPMEGQARELKGVFGAYRRSRYDSPPKTYTMAEVARTEWGKQVATQLHEAGVI